MKVETREKGMGDYRWTLRVVRGGVALLVVIAAFVAVARIFNIVIAGVYPEAWVMTAMMTAPFTIGAVLILTIATALVERARKTPSS